MPTLSVRLWLGGSFHEEIFRHGKALFPLRCNEQRQEHRADAGGPQLRVFILKPKVDTKGSGDLVSRLGVRRPADLLVPPDMDLVEAVRAASSEG